MEQFLENAPNAVPSVSFILVDWSCRESFHTLHYLNHQNIPRDQYEIIWIEFFNRKAEAIQKRLDEDRESGRPPLRRSMVGVGVFQRSLPPQTLDVQRRHHPCAWANCYVL